MNANDFTYNGLTREELDHLDHDDADAEARIDRWHDGYFANRNGKPCPTDPDAADGWRTRENDKHVVVVMPRRPEGYYHMPIGTFD